MSRQTQQPNQTDKPSDSKALDFTMDYLQGLRTRGFYGKIVIEIREGEIVLLREEQTIKPV